MWTINEEKIKKSMTYHGGMVIQEIALKRAKKIFEFVFDMHIRFRMQTAKCILILTFMQKRLKARDATREAKTEILINAWNKLLGQIHDNNLYIKNA